MSAKGEARELAYRTWCACGQNLSETERRLNRDHGLPVTRQTVSEWCKKYDWQNRAARTEAARTEQSEGLGDDAILGSLLEQKTRYEEYFQTLPKGKVDNQALYAYSAVLKTLVELRQSVTQKRLAEVRQELSKITAEFAGKPQKEALESLINVAIAVAATGLVDGSVPVKINLAALVKALPQTYTALQTQPGEARQTNDSGAGLSSEAADEIRKKVLGIK